MVWTSIFSDAPSREYDILFFFYTHDRDGVLRVFCSFRFLSCKSPIGTARHLFSRSVKGTSSGSSTSWINAKTGKAKPTTSVLHDTVSSLDRAAPLPRWLMIANRGCVVFFSSFGECCCSFGESSSKESFWKETARRFHFASISN